MGHILLKLGVGTLAGGLAWALTEPFAPKMNLAGSDWSRWETFFILLLGALIGGGLGAVSGYQRGSSRHFWRGLGLGVLFGGLGGSIGHHLGGGIVELLFGRDVFLRQPFLPIQMMARMAALAPLGLAMGAAVGASGLHWRRALQGAVGGLLGGLVAGALFDPLGQAIGPIYLLTQPQGATETGIVSRALTCLILGGGIALFIALIERVTRVAWLRLPLGRNEWKEWTLDLPTMWIGRDEGAQIPLFGDSGVHPLHAAIQRVGPQYFIGNHAPNGTFVNGQSIAQVPLQHGDRITLGSTQLEFWLRGAGGTPRSIPNVPSPTPIPVPTDPIPQPSPAPASASPASGWTLIALDGPLLGQRFPLHSPVELGREGTAIPIPHDPQASRRHARLTPNPSGVAIEDLGSTNGTFVNGAKVQAASLRAGDEIRIGGSRFRIETS